jgi:hypothetical protein
MTFAQMSYRFGSGWPVLAVLAAGAAIAEPARADVCSAVSGAKTVALVELYTSEGCNSCPPADRWLTSSFPSGAADASAVALAFHVDYWDRLGWKDTFAQHAFTERQRAYASARGDGQVYTPQAVVNGSEHANGANRRAIDASAETTSDLSVPVSAERTGDDVVVSVGAPPSGGEVNATIVLLPYLASREVAIGRGENAREKVTYTNVVRDIVPAGRWSGRPLTRAVSAKDFEGYDGIVVLLQAGTPDKPGAILGATRLALGAKT